MFMNTSQEMWEDSHERFATRDAFRYSNLMEEIQNLRQGNLPKYYTNMRILWDELSNLRLVGFCNCDPQCSCGLLKQL